LKEIYLLVDFARASREARSRKPACNLLLHSTKEKGVSAVLQQSVANKIIVVVPAAVARIPYVVYLTFFSFAEPVVLGIKLILVRESLSF
jgi:hypothetical protein